MADFFNSAHKYPVIIGNLRIPMLFSFSQNPNRLSFTLEKEYQETKTLGGYVFDHWGRKPMTIKGRVLIRKFSDIGGFVGSYRSDNNGHGDGNVHSSISKSNNKYAIEDPIISPELVTLRALFNADQRRLKTMSSAISGIASTLGASNKTTSAITSTMNKFKTNTGASGLSGLSGLAGSTPVVGGMLSGLGTVGDAILTFMSGGTISSDAVSQLADTFIYFKSEIYSGFFVDMTWDEEAERGPFYNIINFTFVVTSTTNDWVEDQLFNSNLGRSITSIWGLGSSVGVAGKVLDSFKK